MTTLLFFDDQRLSRRENVTRGVGRPQLRRDAIFRDPYTNIAWGYPGVFQDETSGQWRMVYQGKTAQGRMAPLLAESDDGLHWTPRDTTRDIALPDRQVPHQLLPLDRFGEWPACYVDPFAEPAERIKGLVAWHATSRNTMDTLLWVSPDGLHWTPQEGVEWQHSGPDPGVGVFWNDVRQSYTFTTRPDYGDRRIGLFETKDWRHFTVPQLAMQADALDTPLAELYAMPVFPYEGYYIGLLWVYHTDPLEQGDTKYRNGHIDCQLAYSLNGWHFQRGLREPFIPNGAPGDPDAGCVYPSSLLVRDDGDIWIVASANTHEHAHLPSNSSAIVTYHLRRDGFVYLESAAGRGIVGTTALFWQQGNGTLNVQGQDGQVRVQVTDPAWQPLDGYTFADGVPCADDDTAWQPVWSGGRTLAQLAGQTVRLEVELHHARLYAVRGDFLTLGVADSRRYNEERITPLPRPGF